MKFQNCILINFVMDARTDGRMDRRTSPNNMLLQLFQSWGHKKSSENDQLTVIFRAFFFFFHFFFILRVFFFFLISPEQTVKLVM